MATVVTPWTWQRPALTPLASSTASRPQVTVTSQVRTRSPVRQQRVPPSPQEARPGVTVVAASPTACAGTNAARVAVSGHGLAEDYRLFRYLSGVLTADDLKPLEGRFDTPKCRIGRGSIGDVVLTQDRITGTKAAVKVVSLSRQKPSDDREASLRCEIEALVGVSHPNIVRLLGVFHCGTRVPGVDDIHRHPPYLCLALEYIADSAPLSGLIRHGGPQPELAWKVVPQIASALQELHARGFVHRDVWSENVLIDGEGRAVLVDFGCAARFLPPTSRHVETRLNVPYMSPQAFLGDWQQPGDDCWAVGCLLTEIVTGVFVADAMGRNDVPLHHCPGVLKNALDVTCAYADDCLGSAACRLLDHRSEHRLQMNELCSVCRSRGDAGPVIPFGARLSGGGGVGSPRRQVSNRSLQRSESPTKCRPVHSVGSTASTVASAIDAGLAQSPVAVTSADKAFIFGSSCIAGPPRSISPDHNRGTGRINLRSRRTADFPAVSVICQEDLPPELAPGARVNYVARSHVGEYKAVVIGRMPALGAWKIRVEGGEDKLVPDSELWRLKRPRMTCP